MFMCAWMLVSSRVSWWASSVRVRFTKCKNGFEIYTRINIWSRIFLLVVCNVCHITIPILAWSIIRQYNIYTDSIVTLRCRNFLFPTDCIQILNISTSVTARSITLGSRFGLHKWFIQTIRPFYWGLNYTESQLLVNFNIIEIYFEWSQHYCNGIVIIYSI